MIRVTMSGIRYRGTLHSLRGIAGDGTISWVSSVVNKA